MRPRCLLLAVMLGLLAAPAGAQTPSVDDLLGQIRGKTCVFHAEQTRCLVRDSFSYRWPLFPYLVRHADYACVIDAVECLALTPASARSSAPTLIALLRQGPTDVDTGDGILPYRSAILRALGRSGTVEAVAPILDALLAREPAFRSPDGAFPADYQPSPEPARPAARAALVDLGDIAVPILERSLHTGRTAEDKSAIEELLRAIASRRVGSPGVDVRRP